MKATSFKFALSIVLVSFLLYVGYLWGTYIDDTATSGSKYGFTIGATKQQTYEVISKVKEHHPQLKIYISHGPRAGDSVILPPTNESYSQIIKQDHWELLLDGEGEFFNVIRLTFDSEKLNEIHRHRQYFELP